MKKLITSLFLLACIATFNLKSASASEYKLDDFAIDQMFSTSIELKIDDSDKTNEDDFYDFLFAGNLKPMDENKQMLAGVIAIASVVLAVGIIFPIHRFILGTGGKPIKIFALYCITLGGCGVITLIDGILLLMDGNGTKYIDNSKFIMWN